MKTAISNELKKANSVPIKTKLNHIREICTFADEKVIDKTEYFLLAVFPPYVLQTYKKKQTFFTYRLYKHCEILAKIFQMR